MNLVEYSNTIDIYVVCLQLTLITHKKIKRVVQKMCKYNKNCVN